MLNKEKYAEIKSEVIEHSQAFCEAEKLSAFGEHIQNKLDNYSPTLIVYGVYNAGKSSLINAIFGESEKAKTGDVPETDKIHPYEYQGFTIYDTPGINAPIEHEEITSDHLKKCELVLFVLSNDGSFEEAIIYDKIGEILQQNKTILIALNNKSGVDMDSQDSINEYEQVAKHLDNLALKLNINDINKSVKLCRVNAKMALKGKLENKQLLIEKSNIVTLESDINDMLKDAGEKAVSNGLNSYIRDFVQKVLQHIDSQIDDKALQKNEEMITKLLQLKEMGNNEFEDIVKKHCSQMEGIIINDLMQEVNPEKRLKQYAENELKNELVALFSELETELMESSKETIEHIKIEFDDKDFKFQEDINWDDLLGKIRIALLVLDKVTNTNPKIAILKQLLIGLVGMLSNIIPFLKPSPEKRLTTAKSQAKDAISKIETSLEKSKDKLNEAFDQILDIFRDLAKKLNSTKNDLSNKKEVLINILDTIDKK